MCVIVNNTVVLKPIYSDDEKNEGPVALTALVPGRHLSDEKLRTFFGLQPIPDWFPRGCLVFEREVTVDNSSDLNTQAWAFAAELQLAFGTNSPHVY